MSVGLVLLLLLTSLPQTMLTTYADIGKYGMRVVDGKGNVIPKGAVTITTVSGGDGETVVDECTYENNGGVWNDIMFDTDYRYRYNAWAKGYTSASGTLSVSDGDLQDFILKKKVRPQFYYEGDLEVAPGAELGPESVRGVDAWQYEGIKLAYMSSDTEVATVNDSGVVTKAGPGKTTISVSVAEDDLIYAQEEGGKSSYEITIKENTQLAFDTTVTDFVDVPLKGTYINKAHCLNRPDNPTITYSSDAGTVDVGEDGTVTLLEQDIYDYNEIVTITAQVDASADGVYQAADISYKIRRTKAECDIPLELTNKVHNMYIGQVSEHKANEDAVAGAVTYTSLNPDIVSCNGSTITALAPGMATIRVERAETGTHRPQMIEYKVEVYEREAAENLYEVIGDLGNNGWYKGDTQVNICAKEGHKLYRGENPYVDYESGAWLDFFDVTEGDSTYQFCVKNESYQAVSDKINQEIQWDKKLDNLDVKVVNSKFNGNYNESVEIEVSVQDSLSGLENVGYRVDRNGEIQKEELLSGDKDKGKNSFKRKFKVSADNLQADIEVEVFAEDMAGNVITKKNNFRINTFIPNISVDFGDENPGMDDNGTFVRVDEETDTGYFKPNEDNSAVRTATVEIECDRGSFYINNIDNNAASQILNSISYTSEQNEERTGAQVASISDWSESEGSNSNTKKYTATVTFTQNGKYEWNPVFTDDSGNTSEEIDFCDSITPKSFVIDNIAPTGSIQGVNKDETVWDELWNSIKDFFTFGQNNTNSDASFVIKGYDTLSPVESIHYYKCLLEGDPEEFEGLTIEELNNLDASEWVLYTSGMKLSGNESFVLYAKIVDYAHNVRYISTDGIMVDGSAPSIELEYPSGVAGYYSDEIKVTAHVHDTGDTATGLDRIFGTVIRYDEQGNPIEEYITKFDDYHISEQGVVYDFDTVIDIPVTGRDGNDVRITVNAVDNVGNTFSTTEYMKFDSTAPDLKVEQPEPELKLYNHDVTLTVEAFDATSSLDKITYTITKSNGEKAEKNCEGKFVHEQNTYKGEIVVPADVNGDVIVDFTARDIAGNITTRQVNFRVNTNQPKITVDFGGDNSVRKIDDRGYFSAARTAKVVVTCDSVFFDPKEATESILSQVVSAVNLNGEEIDLSDISMSDWNTISGATPFNNMHEATVVFAKEGNYTWMPCYTDRAGNVNTTIDYKKSVTPNHFTVDYTKPTGAVTIDGIGTWNDLVSEIDLSRSSKTPKQVTGTAVDTTSPIASVMYYRTSDPVAKTEDELNKITDWKEFSSFISYDNEQMIVYLRMEDYAGNVTYMGTNGVIFDNTDPIITLSLPQGSNVIYAGDVNVGVAVEDPVVNGAFSGIKSITYEILSEGTQTENGTLYTDNNDKADADDLAQKRNYSLKVSAEKNNSNQVAVRVTATDHAGNSYMKIINFMIDITLPEISVAYDNNAGDTSFGDVAYFNKQRVATIRIQERNFSQDQVSLKVTNEDGAVPQISAWSVQPGSGNGDGDVHMATLVFSSDGRYTFDIGFTDQAGNISPKASYGNSLAPTGFVVDTTKPVVEVSYDNNSVKNDNYYNDTRVATVTVREHNFETGRIALNISAKDNDTTINAPTISTWTSNGDVHMATLAFDKDAYYTWNLEYTDKAGNVAEQMASQKFYVDTAAPELTVSGIQNHSANNDEGNIGFALECKDSNFDVFEPALFTVRRDGNSFVEEEIAGVTTSIANGKRFKVENLPNDGIYTLHCVAIDKAGNEYEYVNRMDENGKMAAVPCTSQQDLVNFSVNREGSVFWLNDLTTKVVNSYYVQSVNQDVCVLEANPDPLESYEVELNGLKLQEGVDYTVSLDKEDDSWYLYTYSISHSLFKEEGENSISVQSIDKTQTTAYSDVKNLDISFVVDQTAPVVTLSGLESGGRYQADEQNVTAIVTDDGGRLRSVQVFLLDADGLPMKDSAKNDISRRFDLSGEELDEYLAENNGQVSFTVPEGIYMTVRIICNDYSVDNDGNTNECFEEYKNVTVSPNAFVIFIANRVLQYTLGGVIGGALILIFLILLKKKKDAEKS